MANRFSFLSLVQYDICFPRQVTKEHAISNECIFVCSSLTELKVLECRENLIKFLPV